MQPSRKRKIRGQSTLDGFLQLKPGGRVEERADLGQENQDPRITAVSNGESETGDVKMVDNATALKQVMEAKEKRNQKRSMLR